MAKSIAFPDVRSVTADANQGTGYNVTFSRTSSVVKSGRIYSTLIDCQPPAVPYISWSVQQTIDTNGNPFHSEGAPNTYNTGTFTWSNLNVTADFRYNISDLGTLPLSECLNNPIQLNTWAPFLFVSTFSKTVSYTGGSFTPSSSDRYWHKRVLTSTGPFTIDIFNFNIRSQRCNEHLFIYYCNNRGGIDVISGTAASKISFLQEEGQQVVLYPYQDIATDPKTYPRLQSINARRLQSYTFYFKANKNPDLSHLVYSPEIYIYDTDTGDSRRVFLTSTSIEQTSGIYTINLKDSYFV